MKQEICKCGKIEGNSWSLHRQECKKFEPQKLVPPKCTPKKPKNHSPQGSSLKSYVEGKPADTLDLDKMNKRWDKIPPNSVPKTKLKIERNPGTLSAKGIPWCNRCSIFYCEMKGHRKFNMFYAKDIKEFIQKWKDFIGYTEIEIIKEIDKLAGKELI